MDRPRPAAPSRPETLDAPPPPQPTTPTAAPTPPQPLTSNSRVALHPDGDARDIVLHGDAGAFALPANGAPIEVPEGRYTVRAAFTASLPTPAGAVTLSPGGTVRILCRAAMRTCAPQR
jgi:hypothetical protein